jgi:hypothetical protein
MDEFVHRLIVILDLDSALVVLAASEVVKLVLNLVWRKTYTDFWYPAVAMVMGQLIAYLANPQYDLNVMVYGLKLAGSAIVFSTLWKKFNEGLSWFTKGNEDPILKAKVEQEAAKADALTTKLKQMMKK